MNENRKRATTGTASRTFGSSGRANHDSSFFYSSRMYEELPRGLLATHGGENSVPTEYVDRIICASSEKMSHLPDDSVHLMVTSPPYNTRKDYDRDLTLDEYLDFLDGVWREVHRVLVPGGRACVNVANIGRKPYVPLHAYIASRMAELGFLMRGEVIWNKGSSAGASTAWGSWLSSSNPTLRDTHEYVLVFSKSSFGRTEPPGKASTISKEHFLEYTKSIWSFPAESATRVGHPAPFPVELPFRLIQLYTFSDDLVLDPFMGSGQTGIAALKSGRHFIGYEIDPTYVALAERRISQLQSSEAPPPTA